MLSFRYHWAHLELPAPTNIFTCSCENVTFFVGESTEFCFLFFTELIKNVHSLPQVTQLAGYFEPLIKASVGVASKLKDHQQQMTFLDQTKTLAESALQMLYAAKEGGGNPKV